MAQTVKKLSSQRSDKGLWIYRSKTNVFDSRKARIVSKEITGAVFQRWDVLMANSVSVKISGDVTMICNDAFKYLEEITSVEIAEGVSQIGKNAFYECGGLTEICYTKQCCKN